MHFVLAGQVSHIQTDDWTFPTTYSPRPQGDYTIALCTSNISTKWLIFLNFHSFIHSPFSCKFRSFNLSFRICKLHHCLVKNQVFKECFTSFRQKYNRQKSQVQAYCVLMRLLEKSFASRHSAKYWNWCYRIACVIKIATDLNDQRLKLGKPRQLPCEALCK